MPIDTTDLMQRVYDVFTGAYRDLSHKGAFLAFEDYGVPITPGMFKDDPADPTFDAALAVERLSEISNVVLEVIGDSVLRSNRTVPGITEFMLTQAVPASADPDAMAAFGRVRNPSTELFDVTTLPTTRVAAVRFHPVYASPVNWYDPGANDNWTSHEVGKQDGTGQPATSGSPTPPVRMHFERPAWRLVPAAMQPTLSQPVSRTHPLFVEMASHPAIAIPAGEQAAAHATIAARHAQPMMARSIVSFGAAGTVAATEPQFHAVTRPTVPVTAAMTINAEALKTAGPLLMAEVAAQIPATTTPQSVSSSSVDVSFDHCVVSLARPWWPEAMLMSRSWYVPQYARGEFSSGAGREDAGLLPLLPSAFVAIRNLKISTKWSNDDLVAMQTAAAFGRFSLVGRQFDAASGTLTCPGIQIIGWFCEALPVLPPLSDPALATAGAQTATTQPATPADAPPDATVDAAPAASGAAASQP